MEEEIEMAAGVKVSYENGIICLEGPKGVIKRKLFHPQVNVEVTGNKVKVGAKNATRREKKIIGTFVAHVNNMLEGVQQGYMYRLKICSGHFPMNVSVKDKQFIVKNFFGERIPRTLDLGEGVEVKVKGDTVEVSAASKELAGQTAASIEQLTRRTAYDRRIFQDGIYITEKAITK
ncbi:MAG: 50S ribosomal protein L6 [Candidatus Woesearchaeota archaeon]